MALGGPRFRSVFGRFAPSEWNDSMPMLSQGGHAGVHRIYRAGICAISRFGLSVGRGKLMEAGVPPKFFAATICSLRKRRR